MLQQPNMGWSKDTGRDQIGVHMGCQYHRRRISLICHHASPRKCTILVPFQQLWSTARFFHPRSLRWASPNWTPSTPEVMEVGSVLPSWVTFRVNCSPRVDEQNTEHIPYKVTPVYEVLQIKTLQILSPASPLNTVQLWRISLKSWRWYHQQARGNESCETVGLAFNILLWGRKKTV